MKTEKTTKTRTTPTRTAAKASAAQALDGAPARTSTMQVNHAQVATAHAAAAPAIAPQVASSREITSDLIAARAYIIWEQQGRPHGHDLANWLLAESQLKQEQSFTA